MDNEILNKYETARKAFIEKIEKNKNFLGVWKQEMEQLSDKWDEALDILNAARKIGAILLYTDGKIIYKHGELQDKIKDIQFGYYLGMLINEIEREERNISDNLRKSLYSEFKEAIKDIVEEK